MCLKRINKCVNRLQMSSNQPTTSNYMVAQNVVNSQSPCTTNNLNGLNSSNSLYSTSANICNSPKAAKLVADYKQIILELSKSFSLAFRFHLMFCHEFELFLGAQNFDVIRFATYRTASKLRFIQKKLNRKMNLFNFIFF